MNHYLKEYFIFSKKERTGIIILVALILIVTVLPRFFSGPSLPERSLAKELDSLALQWRLLIADTVRGKTYTGSNRYNDSKVQPIPVVSCLLFPFDPNTLTIEGWKKMGVPDKTIRTARNYLAHGGRFRKPEDLGRIYGLKKDIYERILPYVQIAVPDKVHFSQTVVSAKPLRKEPVNINDCDTSALIALPGIGARLAQRIVNFREKLGGFHAIEQIGEVYGLPDSTFQLIRERLICPETVLKKININDADINTLRQHPYIKWNLANAIVRFRQQHGPFLSPGDLMRIEIMTPEIFKKLVFYLAIE